MADETGKQIIQCGATFHTPPSYNPAILRETFFLWRSALKKKTKQRPRRFEPIERKSTWDEWIINRSIDDSDGGGEEMITRPRATIIGATNYGVERITLLT